MAAPKPTPTGKRQGGGFQFTGVNESGAEFGNLAIPGHFRKDYYTWPDQTAITVSLSTAELFVVPSRSYQSVTLMRGKTMINQWFNTLRIPLRMLASVPSNRPMLSTSTPQVSFRTPHENKDNPYQQKSPHISDRRVHHRQGRPHRHLPAKLRSLLRRDHQQLRGLVAERYAGNAKVIFDTHNEDNVLVASLSQAAIDAIRSVSATSQYIFVAGNSWTGVLPSITQFI
ncbi:hypothetical protein F4775DRAFT_592148 [Biscogniauxia sp. FL1348]|nr:hypothetical protein F4775DRAFT_592148 [Biscogniauxia sp. FL1348]